MISEYEPLTTKDLVPGPNGKNILLKMEVRERLYFYQVFHRFHIVNCFFNPFRPFDATFVSEFEEPRSGTTQGMVLLVRWSFYRGHSNVRFQMVYFGQL
jgi:hypothetical protein